MASLSPGKSTTGSSGSGVGGQPLLLHLLLLGDSHGQLLARGEVVVLEDLLDNKNVDVSISCRSGQHGGEGAVVVLYGVYLLGLSIIIDHLLDLRVIDLVLVLPFGIQMFVRLQNVGPNIRGCQL